MSPASNVKEERVCCRLLVLCLVLVAAALPLSGEAASRSFRLSAPEVLVETGFLKFLLPRFSLKTGIRIEIVAEGGASDAMLSSGPEGTFAFTGPENDWYLAVPAGENEMVLRFRDWLTGDIGKKTIDAFRADGKVLFTAAVAQPEVAETDAIPGNVVEGEKLAVVHCGRCHMVNEATRLSTIGSSPSFAVMRSFSDWRYRFEAFFVLNPHPSFTQLEGVTEPFDESLPPSMVPLTMTLEELDAILAFVSRIPPADLGAPIRYE